jgi:hypothetical protein
MTGLRRFVGAPAAAPSPPADLAESCEMCGAPTGPGHGHVIDSEQRSILCSCRACYLLFTRPDAGRFRSVPDRVLHDPDRPLSTVEWEGLGIPVGTAFFLRSANGLTAFYPSPAGATECLLDLDAWARLETTHPLLAAIEQDVEAVIIRGHDDTVECYLVPVDLCYQLVGLVRLYWKGFDGGQEAHEHIDAFFEQLSRRARRA